MTASLSTIDRFIVQELRIPEIQDEQNALNGLQVDATGGAKDDQVRRIALSVDASEFAIDQAAALKADMLLVHHGLFWGGHRRMVGPYGRKIRKCVEAGISVYSVHLPLDVHPELGNNVGIARALDLPVTGPFGSHRGLDLGVEVDGQGISIQELMDRCAKGIGPVHLHGAGPEKVHRIGVVSGGGGSCLREAAAKGMDALITGETAHYTALDAEEAGVHLILGGHYRTETFGVKALGKRLAEEFGLTATFIDHDTGM